ncbi:MCE family protein [Sulfurimonas sp. SAG-AH-194-I05]|nr:MlaD family protein [Sulfurimonas sp. SAG-AH-194-I05]MDF1874117.1 MCE family protein [Sulfurimonas sp. SAG-AH-194-I05]
MEKRLSYIIVGTFVIVITIALLSFLFWLTKYGNTSIKHDYYYTYFEESVSGLNIESLVKLRGVEVGRVKKITINKDNSEEVEVLLEILQDTPIKVDTFTVLDSQGITGLKYIELKGGYNKSQRLPLEEGKIAVIPSKKSVMSHLFDSSESITVKIETILDKVNYVLSKHNMDQISSLLSKTNTLMSNENMNNISLTMDNVAETTTYINQNKQKMSELVVSINDFLEHTKQFERDMLPSITKMGVMSDKASGAADRTSEFFVDMRKELKNGEFNMASIIEENLQILNETAISLRDLSLKMESTVEAIKESPSDLLYKSNKKILGPGESHD